MSSNSWSSKADRRATTESSTRERDPRRRHDPEGTKSSMSWPNHEEPPDSSNPVFGILVMGLTGVGKSTFISKLTQKSIGIGHTLESCTAQVDGFPYQRSNGQTIWLVDTPGFDDSNKGNVIVLEDIASKLCTFYDSDMLRIVGIIYFQRISDVRMAGSSLASLRMFEKICGPECFPQITIATSFWSLLQDDESKIGEEREKTLRDDDMFFGKLIKGGAKMKRYADSYEDARDIVESFFERQKDVVLAIQREMVDGRMALVQTSVGQYLNGDLEAVRDKYERTLQELSREYDEAIAEEQDEDTVTTISEEKKVCEERIKQSEVAQKSLLVTYEDMICRQQDLLSQAPSATHRVTSAQEKSARELELEEQLERVQMDHFREMNNARRSKEAEVTGAYLQGYEDRKRMLEQNLADERAGKVTATNNEKMTLGQILSNAFTESFDFIQGATRASSFPQESKQALSLRPKIDLSNARLTKWARQKRALKKAREQKVREPRAHEQPGYREQMPQASLKFSGRSDSYRSQSFQTYAIEQDHYESDESDEYTSEGHYGGYQTIERYPEGTALSERGKLMVAERSKPMILGPKRRHY